MLDTITAKLRSTGELDEDEVVRWLGRPQLRRYRGQCIAYASFGLFWLALALALVPEIPRGFQLSDLTRLTWSFDAIPVAIGLALLSSPLYVLWQAWKTKYLITDRRAITIQPGPWWTTFCSITLSSKDQIQVQRVSGRLQDVRFCSHPRRGFHFLIPSSGVEFLGLIECDSLLEIASKVAEGRTNNPPLESFQRDPTNLPSEIQRPTLPTPSIEEHRRLMGKLLRPDEILLWSDRPSAIRFTFAPEDNAFIALLIIVFIHVDWAKHLSLDRAQAVLFLRALWCLLALGAITHWACSFWNARHRCYAITNKRAFILQSRWLRKTRVTWFAFNHGSAPMRMQNRDLTGDLLLWQDLRDDNRRQFTFLGVRDVRKAERLVRHILTSPVKT